MVLVVDAALAPARLDAALLGGDVATVIVVPRGGAPSGSSDDPSGDGVAELVALVQGFGVAAMVADVELTAHGAAHGVAHGADGVHLPAPPRERDAALLLGLSAKDRHAALEAGEAGADYVLFGPPPGRAGRVLPDTHPEPHPTLLELARWWTDVTTVPCIVPGGHDVASVLAAAQTGAEGVALHSAIFGADGARETAEIGEAVRRANALLDEHAPRFA